MKKRILIQTVVFLLVAAAVFTGVWLIYHHSEGDFYYDISQDMKKIENSDVAYICDPSYQPSTEDLSTFLTNVLTSPAMLYFAWDGQTYRSADPAVKEKIAAVFQKEVFARAEENITTETTEIGAINNAAYQILITQDKDKTFLTLWSRKTSHHSSFATETNLRESLKKVLSEVTKVSEIVTNPNELTQFE